MIHKVFIILLISYSNLFAFSSLDSIFYQANELYQLRQFEEAINAYESILGEDIDHVLYYNLGNCYYKLNKLGYARLYYEKSILYNPGDKDVIHNLEVVKAKLIDEITPIPKFFLINIIYKISMIFNPSQWGYVTILFIYFNIALILWFLFTPLVGNKINLLRSLFISIPLCFIVVFFLFFSNFKAQNEIAVLVTSNEYVKTAPSVSSSDYFIIHEGVKFQIIDQVDGWFRILLEDGKDGWIQDNSFEKVNN